MVIEIWYWIELILAFVMESFEPSTPFARIVKPDIQEQIASSILAISPCILDKLDEFIAEVALSAQFYVPGKVRCIVDDYARIFLSLVSPLGPC